MDNSYHWNRLNIFLDQNNCVWFKINHLVCQFLTIDFLMRGLRFSPRFQLLSFGLASLISDGRWTLILRMKFQILNDLRWSLFAITTKLTKKKMKNLFSFYPFVNYNFLLFISTFNSSHFSMFPYISSSNYSHWIEFFLIILKSF